MATGAPTVTRAWLDRALDLGLAAAPVIFAVPVLAGIGAGLVELLGTAHPYFGDGSGINFDGLALRLGAPLYQDPGAGYTPEPYSPLLPVLVAGLDFVKTWSGWTILLTIVSALALMSVAAWLAYAPSGRGHTERAAALAGAIGMGALAFWLVAFVPFNLLYSGRSDHLSWAFGLTGLVLLPAFVRGSTRAGVAAIVFLSLAFWAKQTGVATVGAGLAWLLIAAARGRCPWRRVIALVSAFAAINGAVWMALDVLTDGWSVAFIVDMPADRGRSIGFGESLRRLLRATAAPALLVAVLWLPVLWRRLRDGRRAGAEVGRGVSARAAAAAPLALFVVLSVPLAARFGQGQGSVDNHYLGVAWALALIAAVGFGLDQRRRSAAIVAAAALVALFVSTESSSVVDRLHGQRIFVPAKAPRAYVDEEPAALRALAARRAVYHPIYSDVSVEATGQVYPTDYNIWGLISSGRQPGYMVDALLGRRFDVVYQFQDPGSNNGFGADRLEDNYVWKLNEVVRRKYRPAHVSPALDAARSIPVDVQLYKSPGIWFRRPGPDPAPWLSACFGPFRLRATTWDIRAGGGLWCRLPRGGQKLRLVGTPAIVSEVRSRQSGAATGAIGVTVPEPGAWAEIAPAGGDPEWSLRIDRPRDGSPLVATLVALGAAQRVVSAPASPVRLRLRAGPRAELRRAGEAIAVRLPPGGSRALALRASAGGGATFDLANLRVR